MTARRAVAVAACAAIVCAGAVAAGPAEAVLPRVTASRLQVGAREFRFSLSRLSVQAGQVTVQLVNYGEDDHDLRLRRIGSRYVYRLPRTAPGDVSDLTARFRGGTFRLWCSLSGHRAAGMSSTLEIRRPA